jgi:hypothetical protein
MKHSSFLLLSLVASLFLHGCTSLEGIVSAQSHSGIPQPVLFYVSSDSSSRTDDKITALIEAKMVDKGFQKASAMGAANVGVTYKYSINQYAEPDYSVWHFQVDVLDLRQRIPDNIELFWQGEIYSAGTSRDIGLIAPYFIDVLFENFDRTVPRKNFSRQIELFKHISMPRLKTPS